MNILQNKEKIDNMHRLSVPKMYQKPILQKSHKMTYLGSFWDLNGSFWGPEVNIFQNKVKIDNVHWLSFPKRYHKPILQKSHKMTYLGVFLGPNLVIFGVLKYLFFLNDNSLVINNE